MYKVLIIGCFIIQFVGCNSDVLKQGSRVLLEESETFYLSRIPRRVQVSNNMVFVHDSYHQSIGVFDMENGKLVDIYGLDDMDFKDMYLSVFKTDSLVLNYFSVYNLPYFKDGIRLENIYVENDSVNIILSISIPYHDSDLAKGNYTHWYVHSFLVSFDKKSKDYEWSRILENGFNNKLIAPVNLSNFFKKDDFLIFPLNLINDNSTKLIVFSKVNKHQYDYNDIIDINGEAIKLSNTLYSSELINYGNFIQVNESNDRNYIIEIDVEQKVYLSIYNLKDEVTLERYFPIKKGVYACVDSRMDTVLSLDWKKNSVPFIDNDNRVMTFVRYENEKYYLHTIPF